MPTLGRLHLRFLQAIFLDVIDMHKAFLVSYVGEGVFCCHCDSADLGLVSGLKDTCTGPIRETNTGPISHTHRARHRYTHRAHHRHTDTNPHTRPIPDKAYLLGNGK